MWRRGGAARLGHGRNEHVGAPQAALKEAERAGPPVLGLNVLAMVALAGRLARLGPVDLRKYVG
jgi:hypothetical protein